MCQKSRKSLIGDRDAIPAFFSCDGLKDSDTADGYMRYKAHYIKEEDRSGARMQIDGVHTVSNAAEEKWRALCLGLCLKSSNF